MPITFNGSLQSVLLQPAAPDPAAARPLRGSCDPDDYSSGFALWSGTSFAAPAYAGDLAASLVGEEWCEVTDPKAEGTDPKARAESTDRRARAEALSKARVEGLAKAIATLEDGER